jgi:maltose O-acetyltransferase
VTIGEGCFINKDGYLRPGTTLGNWVFLGPFVRLITDGHEVGLPGKRAGANTSLPIHVGDGAWIGAGSTVLGGVTIGAGAIVAAGSVVTKNVPSNTLVGGVPAQFIKHLNDETAPTFPEEDGGRSVTLLGAR